MSDTSTKPQGIVERLREDAISVAHFFHNIPLRMVEAAATIEALAEALRGVVKVADRKTDEFDRARAALALLEPKPRGDEG